MFTHRFTRNLTVVTLVLLAGLPALAQHHSADTTPDQQISLTELLRVIQFFNTRGFHCVTPPDTSEDGFLPGAGGDVTCAPHDSDYLPRDWSVNLTELLRLIQFFNTRGYHTECGTEDDFVPGMGGLFACGVEGEGVAEGEGEGEGSVDTVELTGHVSPVNAGLIVPSGGSYLVGASAELVAIPDAGWRFDHWSGDLIGSTNPTVLIMDTAKDVTAVFVQRFTLTTSATGYGTVAPTGGTYDANDVVELTANPGMGWRFDYWSGDLTGSANPDSITMDTAKSVTATFIQQYALTTNVTGAGSVSPSSGGVYDTGALVELTATPEEGWRFDYWSEDLTGSENPVSITMDTAKSVTATFSINQYTLTYTAGDNGSITGATSQTVNYGTNGTAVEAVPATSYHFVRWSDDSTQNPRIDANVTADINVTATFSINEYTLTYTAGDNGSITGETPQTVNHGASGTAVEAVPTTGYHFIRWSDTSTANPRADSDVTGDISVMAEFASNTETIVLPGGIPLEMVWIPAGAFQMGRNPSEQDSYANEDPRHVVAFASGFWMGKYELTQAQWVAVMGNNPSSYTGDLQRPVETVSWNDIQVFIAFLNIATGKTFRLPSEAEREYACRAGTTTRFYWGDDTSYTEIDNYAWYQGNSAGKTHAVGGKLPNGWGLYDMSGNVYEYCEDDWHESYSGAPANGNAWVDSPRNSLRVLRGGGFDFTGIPCRSAVRGREGLSGAYSNFGLRLAR